MDYACFGSAGDKLIDIVKREYGEQDDTSFEATMRRIEKLNPQVPSKSTIPPNVPVYIPDPNVSSTQPILPEGAGLMPLLTQLPCDARNVLAELDNEEQADLVAALMEFLDTYDLWSLSGDLNTYGGAGVGNTVNRVSGIYRAIADIDSALVELKNTPRPQRAAAVQKVRRLYKHLHENFGFELKQILARNAAKIKKGHPLMSSQRGINLAGGRRTKHLPLTNTNSVKNLSRFATAGRIAGKGIIMLDLGLRGRTIYNQWESGGAWQRELFGQTVGFGASFISAGIAFSLMLGPFGVVLAIILAGVVAVGADYLGKGLGYKVFDAGNYLVQYIQAPYVY